MSRLLIVDGHAYAYRAFHAIRELRAPTGEPTNAIFGFIKMLAKMRAKLKSPESRVQSPPSVPPRRDSDCGLWTGDSGLMTVVVWDGGLSAERVAALPGYKAQRPEMPADLAAQIDEIVRYLEAANVASFCQDGVEADDYIACLARCASGADLEVVIASSDKDFMQLVAPGIGLLNPNDKTETVWTAEQVRNKTGVEPAQIVDWLALVGDSVDNIPGVPGVGPKTAADLLRQFGSIEVLYRRLGEVKSDRLRAALENSAEAVRRNQDLVRLKADLPCDSSLEDFREKPADAERLAGLFRRWGFRSLLAEVEASSRSAGQQAVLL